MRKSARARVTTRLRNNMKQTLFVALLMVTLLTVCAAQTGKKKPIAFGNMSTEELLVTYEKQSWEAVKRKDYKTFESFLAEDFYDVFPNGQVINKSELMQNYIRGVDLIDYSLSHFKVIVLGKDAAIVVYTADARGVENQSKSRNEKVSAIHAAVTSGWTRRNGKWLNIFYRECDIK
jgi:hypothetical protein